MSQKSKRLRIMAGPNGSGKSTILQTVRQQFYSGPFVNADLIEKKLNESGSIDLFTEFGLKVSSEDLVFFLKNNGQSWIEKSGLSEDKINLKIEGHVLLVGNNVSPYIAAICADFIRNQLLVSEQTFTIETVLSHPSKISFLKDSIRQGFKNYLYFICTVDPSINSNRVKQRVQEGGHDVPQKKIEERYFRSLELLVEVIPLCYRIYFFDNSTTTRSIEPVAEIDSEKKMTIFTENVPWWLEEYVIRKLF